MLVCLLLTARACYSGQPSESALFSYGYITLSRILPIEVCMPGPSPKGRKPLPPSDATPCHKQCFYAILDLHARIVISVLA